MRRISSLGGPAVPPFRPRPFRADLTLHEHVALFVAKIHGQLLAVLVDGKV